MTFQRIANGMYRGKEGAATASIDRDEYGKWFWTVCYEGGGTSGGIHYSLAGAKKAATTAAARRISA